MFSYSYDKDKKSEIGSTNAISRTKHNFEYDDYVKEVDKDKINKEIVT